MEYSGEKEAFAVAKQAEPHIFTVLLHEHLVVHSTHACGYPLKSTPICPLPKATKKREILFKVLTRQIINHPSALL